MDHRRHWQSTICSKALPITQRTCCTASTGQQGQRNRRCNRRQVLDRGETLACCAPTNSDCGLDGQSTLINEIAILNACGPLHAHAEHLAQLWCNDVLRAMPSTQTSLLASNLKILLEVVDSMFQDETAQAFRAAIMQLVDVARRTEAATRLAEIVDKVSIESAEWAIENYSQFAADRRASYRDVRLVLSKIVQLIPSGPAGVNGHLFRAFMAKLLLPNLPFNVSILRQVYDRVIRVLEAHATPEDAKLARAYLEDALPMFDRHARLHAIAAHAIVFRSQPPSEVIKPIRATNHSPATVSKLGAAMVSS